MDELQAYLFLFKDSFITSLMFVPKEPYAADAMVMLGNFNPYLILLVSLIASIIASSFNWLLGLSIRKLENFKYFHSRIDSLSKAEVFFNQKGKWILLLSCIPLWGGLFTTAAGILRYKFYLFIILVSFSKFVGQAIKIFF